jgi:hypothetical protein
MAHSAGLGLEGESVGRSLWQHPLALDPPHALLPSRIAPRGWSGTTTPNQTVINASRKIRNARPRTGETIIGNVWGGND